MAKELGKTAKWVEENLTNEDLTEWNAYLNIEESTATKQDIYLARIAFMLCSDKKVSLQDFIINFEENKKPLKLGAKQLAQELKTLFGVK